jgi:protoporphyrinogen oxidase
MASEQLGYPMGGFGEVFATLGERIIEMGGEVKTSAQVHRIVVEGGQTTGLEVKLPDGKATVEPFDAVIATVPSYALPPLLPEVPESYLKLLTGVTYLSAVLIILVLDRPLTWAYWINVADRDIPIVAIIEQTNLLPPERYGGKHIVYLSNYLGRENPLYHMNHKELLAEYLPHIPKFNPAFDPSWIHDSFYHRVAAAQPVITPNYAKRIPPHQTPFKALYLANTTQVYPEDRGTNYSVRLGRKVARLLLKDHGHAVKGKLPTPVITTSITSADEW